MWGRPKGTVRRAGGVKGSQKDCEYRSPGWDHRAYKAISQAGQDGEGEVLQEMLDGPEE